MRIKKFVRVNMNRTILGGLIGAEPEDDFSMKLDAVEIWEALITNELSNRSKIVVGLVAVQCA